MISNKTSEAIMKNSPVKSASSSFSILAATVMCMMFFNSPLKGAEVSSGTATAMEPQSVLAIMERVADWQLAHPSHHPPTDWTQAAGDAGMMALAGISANPKYIDAMMAMGEANNWQLGPRLYMADDHCIGQTYAELYLRYRENEMIATLKARFDSILTHPSDVSSLDMNQPDNTTGRSIYGHGATRCSWVRRRG